MARTTVLTSEQRAEILRLDGDGEGEETIAEQLDLHTRTVLEVIRASTKTIREIAERAGKPRSDGGILDRVAARAAGLPRKEQRRIWRSLKGASQTEGIRLVQEAEHQIHGECKNRGRKPKPFDFAENVQARCWDLEQRLAELPRADGADPSVRAYKAMLAYLRGDKKLGDLPGLRKR